MKFKLVAMVLASFHLTISFASPLQRPKLGTNEFAVFKDNKYQIVKMKNFKGLELSQTCFKDKAEEPSCQAYKFAIQKFSVRNGHAEYINSPGTEYCKAMSGKSFTGVSSTGAESDFCFFNDGSVVKSWSAYFLHYPTKVIK